MAWNSQRIIGGCTQKNVAKPPQRDRPAVRASAEEILLSLGTKLKAIREEQKLFVAHVAKRTGIAPQTIIQLENSGRPVRFPVMYQIAECLNFKLEFLLSAIED